MTYIYCDFLSQIKLDDSKIFLTGSKALFDILDKTIDVSCSD